MMGDSPYTHREIKSLNLKMKKLEGWKKAERRQIRDVSNRC
jgi:hypothetical protein